MIWLCWVLLWKRMQGIFIAQTWRMGKKCLSLTEKFGISPSIHAESLLILRFLTTSPPFKEDLTHQRWICAGPIALHSEVRNGYWEACHSTCTRGDSDLALAETQLEGPHLLPVTRTDKTKIQEWEASELKQGGASGGCRLFSWKALSIHKMYKLKEWIDDGSIEQQSQGPWHCCVAAKLCLTLCNPMGCSTPGSPVLHHL